MSCCSPSFLRMRRRAPQDHPQVESLLSKAGLPTEDLDSGDGLVLEKGGDLLGHVGFERTPLGILVRSLVVHTAHQGKGYGQRLIEAVEAEADGLPIMLPSHPILW